MNTAALRSPMLPATLAMLATMMPACSSRHTASPTKDLPGWKLTFADEFSAPAGTPPDPTKWGYDLGGHGWGNNELQCYTSSTKNSFHDGSGNLVIRAIKEQTTDDKGTKRDYSSARILTKGKFSQTYGRFEARLKVPVGRGIWPAFWTLGENITTKNWPHCGEIDIMEYLGHDTMTAYGTIHGPGYSGAEGKSKPFKLTSAPSFHDDFHTFAIEWSESEVLWFIDGQQYHRVTPDDLKPSEWVFDTPFFMILNLAVGGNWPGNPDDKTTLPQDYSIDYVRVYERVKR
ncbi:MAG TPA: glycoside hydrolase family 16 protein [Phycisphaerales bacterium]|nr:glycoside hydrolase family 16 protein [Phycisphaerales bacterium]